MSEVEIWRVLNNGVDKQIKDPNERILPSEDIVIPAEILESQERDYRGNLRETYLPKKIKIKAELLVEILDRLER